MKKLVVTGAAAIALAAASMPMTSAPAAADPTIGVVIAAALGGALAGAVADHTLNPRVVTVQAPTPYVLAPVSYVLAPPAKKAPKSGKKVAAKPATCTYALAPVLYTMPMATTVAAK